MPLNVREYSFSNLTINIDNQFLNINDKKIKLREKDVDVLIFLLDNVNTVVSRNEILCAVWKHNLHPTNDLLNSAISRLKKELKHIPNITVETVYGSGYKLNVKEEKYATKKRYRLSFIIYLINI
jgi:DNA-binding winged helix-turn-helix (wHTH) protein